MKQKKIHINFFSYKCLYSYIFTYINIFTYLISYTKESICTEELPFYNKIYNCCVDYCPYRNILSSLCTSSSEIKSSIEITLKIIEELLKNSTLNIGKYEYAIKGENIIYQITTTELLKKYINNSYANSYLDLDECENNLKLKNAIKLSDPLIIILINIMNTSYITTYDKGFFIYDPINKTKLDIYDSCNSIDNVLYFNISVLQGNYTNKLNYTLFKRKGFNLANIDDPFYTDICKNYTFDYNSDFPLNYRKEAFSEYLYNTCGDNCTMIDYDFNNNKISCKCYTSYDNKIKAEKKGNVFDKAKINFNVLQCYKNIINLNFKKIYTVIIFMLLSFLLLLFIILMIIYCIRKNKSFKQIIDNIMKNNKTLLKRINILEGRINNNNCNIKDEDEKDNFQEKQISNLYLSRTNPSNLVTRALKDSSFRVLMIQNDNNLKEKIRKVNKRKENENEKNIEYNYTTKKSNKFNTRVIYEKKLITKIPESQFMHNKCENNNILYKKNNENKTNKGNDKLIVENILISEYTEYNIVKKIYDINKDERLLYYYDTEMNLFDYEKALQIDTRSLLRYYWSIISDNDILLYSFGLWYNDYNFSTVKLSFFIFSFNLILFINILFMSEKDIYHLFETEGKYKYIYYLLNNTFSMLICTIIILLMKYLVIGINEIFSIRYFEKEEFDEKVKKLIEKIHTKNIIFFIIGLIFNICFSYFIICFCLVYVNNEIIVISNGFVTLAEIALYPFILGILSIIFRHIAIKSEEKNKKTLYKFNQYFEFILL